MEKNDSGLIKLLGSARSLALNDRITLQAFRAGGKLFC